MRMTKQQLAWKRSTMIADVPEAWVAKRPSGKKFLRLRKAWAFGKTEQAEATCAALIACANEPPPDANLQKMAAWLKAYERQ